MALRLKVQGLVLNGVRWKVAHLQMYKLVLHCGSYKVTIIFIRLVLLSYACVQSAAVVVESSVVLLWGNHGWFHVAESDSVCLHEPDSATRIHPLLPHTRTLKNSTTKRGINRTHAWHHSTNLIKRTSGNCLVKTYSFKPIFTHEDGELGRNMYRVYMQ
jgi:hypothetical protein